MAGNPSGRKDLEVHLGARGLVVGRLHLGSGKRSAFSYDEAWLRDARFFNPSPDLQPVPGVQYPQGVFFHAPCIRSRICQGRTCNSPCACEVA